MSQQTSAAAVCGCVLCIKWMSPNAQSRPSICRDSPSPATCTCVSLHSRGRLVGSLLDLGGNLSEDKRAGVNKTTTTWMEQRAVLGRREAEWSSQAWGWGLGEGGGAYLCSWGWSCSTAPARWAPSDTRWRSIPPARNPDCTRSGSQRPRQSCCPCAGRSGAPGRSCTEWRSSVAQLWMDRDREKMGVGKVSACACLHHLFRASSYSEQVRTFDCFLFV